MLCQGKFMSEFYWGLMKFLMDLLWYLPYKSKGIVDLKLCLQ